MTFTNDKRPAYWSTLVFSTSAEAGPDGSIVHGVTSPVPSACTVAPAGDGTVRTIASSSGVTPTSCSAEPASTGIPDRRRPPPSGHE